MYMNEELYWICRFEHYYGVDPYNVWGNYTELSYKNQTIQDRVYQRVQALLRENFGKNRNEEFFYKCGVVGILKKGSIDFINVDGRHDYCSQRGHKCVLSDFKVRRLFRRPRLRVQVRLTQTWLELVCQRLDNWEQCEASRSGDCREKRNFLITIFRIFFNQNLTNNQFKSIIGLFFYLQGRLKSLKAIFKFFFAWGIDAESLSKVQFF